MAANNDKKIKKELKTSVYSLRLTKIQKNILNKNNWIKLELDKMILEYINSYI